MLVYRPTYGVGVCRFDAGLTVHCQQWLYDVWLSDAGVRPAGHSYMAAEVAAGLAATEIVSADRRNAAGRIDSVAATMMSHRCT